LCGTKTATTTQCKAAKRSQQSLLEPAAAAATLVNSPKREGAAGAAATGTAAGVAGTLTPLMGAAVGTAGFSGSALARMTTERLDVAKVGRTEATALRDSIVAAIALSGAGARTVNRGTDKLVCELESADECLRSRSA
jgi:hypothetical protein